MRLRIWICTIVMMTLAATASAQEPHLAFSDLISGPQTGLSDGLGEGAIITIWGNRFGDQKGDVWLIDSDGQRHDAAHIYYWRRADGELPGGPANLWRSHQIYEVAFSLPRSLPDGEAEIHLADASGTPSNNTLAFTVRLGNIYHVTDSGSPSNDGSFTAPWRYISAYRFGGGSAGNGRVEAGDIVYSHGVREISEQFANADRGRAGIWVVEVNGTADKQVAFVSYPNTQAFASGPNWGIHPYLSSGLVFSKFHVEVGHIDEPPPGSPVIGVSNASNSNENIRASKNGRIIGNYLVERPGKCATGFAGAIVANGYNASGLKAFGNHIFDHGCDQTSHFQHTTYITIRTDAIDDQGNTREPLDGWEFGWNFLEDNKAKFGLHFYDQWNAHFERCLNFKPGSVLSAHNNVIINQKGSAINIRAGGRTIDGVHQPCWNVDGEIYNNLIINAGLGPVGEENNGTSPQGITAGAAINGNFNIYNNTISRVSDPSSRSFPRGGGIQYNTPYAIALSSSQGATFTVSNNLVYLDYPAPYVAYSADENSTLNLSNNLWYNQAVANNPSLFKASFLEHLPVDSEIADPLIINELPLHIATDSPTWTGGSSEPVPNFDLAGIPVGKNPHRGAKNDYMGYQIQPPANFSVRRIE
ncbi:hypothetical protein [Salinibius halmophilus]|uniref:hypothetical protein n=1 Tax=Salinibius halmophilus TaxID=1853216 RepID=UPI000E66C328|nr:hypothetical protein [Salinibius halmophilus]